MLVVKKNGSIVNVKYTKPELHLFERDRFGRVLAEVEKFRLRRIKFGSVELQVYKSIEMSDESFLLSIDKHLKKNF